MGLEEGHFICRTAGCRMAEAEVCQPKCVQFPPHPPSPLNPPLHPNPPSSSCLELLLSLLYCFVDAVGGDAAGGEPGWSLTAASRWRPHRGPPGGTLQGRPPQRLARALPRPGPHAPILQCAVLWRWHWRLGWGQGAAENGWDGVRHFEGKRTVGVVIRCECGLDVLRCSVYKHWISSGLEAECRRQGCPLVGPKWQPLSERSALSSGP